jgi:branched-chain amino acid transport system substrate-binding protein
MHPGEDNMTTFLTRRTALLAAATCAATLSLATAAYAQTSIKIGYAISRTGPNTGGAAVTTIPNYELWVKEVNAAGGIKLGDKRVPIEVVQYDDRSNAEEAVRALERLINQDKVDFILPPWGTAFNSAVAPLLAKASYPHLAVTFTVEDPQRFIKRFPNMFVFTGSTSEYAEALVEILSSMRSRGSIGNNIAMVGVSDQFGLELASAGRKAFQKAGFKLVMDKSYPFGSQDLAGIITEASRANPDAFVAFSYPPDTMGLTEQARALKFNPKVFYAAVATAFPAYRQRFGANVEGIFGPGGWNANSPESKSFFERFKKVNNGQEPDRWASPIAYASLQILQQAIERVGVDRKAVIKEIATGTFDTILGQRKLTNQMMRSLYLVAQWQDGEFNAVWPQDLPGTTSYRTNKPAWQ